MGVFLHRGIAGRGTELRRARPDPARAFPLDGRTKNDIGLEEVDVTEGAGLVRDLMGRARVNPCVRRQSSMTRPPALVGGEA